MESQIKREKVFLTPELAEKYLGMNYDKNRRISKGIVRQYADDILTGRWRDYLADPLVFDKDGTMINGQHRCSAVILADKGIMVEVIRGAETEDYAVIDTGKARTAKDALIEYPSAVQLAGLAKACIQYELNGLSDPWAIRGGDRYRVSNSQIVEYVHGYDAKSGTPAENELLPYLHYASKCKHSGLIGTGALAFVAKTITENAPERGEVFLKGLQTGCNLSEGSPMLTLRNKILRQKGDSSLSKGNGVRPTFVLAWCIKAWNAYISGKSIRVISYNPDKETMPSFVFRSQ